MSDNQRYYDIFNNAVQYFEREGSKVPDQHALDAVVAAVRDLEAKHATDLVASRLWAFDQGRQAAARDIRALVAQGASEKEAEYYARIAEGGQEVAPPV